MCVNITPIQNDVAHKNGRNSGGTFVKILQAPMGRKFLSDHISDITL